MEKAVWPKVVFSRIYKQGKSVPGRNFFLKKPSYFKIAETQLMGSKVLFLIGYPSISYVQSTVGFF